MSEIMGILLTFLPLFVIFMMANSAERKRQQEEPYQNLEFASYLLTGLLYIGTGIFGILVQLFGIILQRQPELLDELALGIDFPAVNSYMMLGLGVWLPSALGIIVLFPFARRFLSRFIPIDPDSPVHTLSLSYTMLIIINLMITLGIGLDTLGDTLANNGSDEQGITRMLGLWAQQISTALLAMIGVGWLTRRNWQATMKRLGIVIPTTRQVMLGIGIGLGLVPLMFLIEGIGQLVGVGFDPDVEQLTEELLGPLFRSPIGIITLGLAAALGEETIFRGAIHTRFGLVLTALLFALVHSNYGITLSTAVVFAIGLILGMIRTRHNTSTAMIVHAVYNMALGVMAYLAITYGEFPQ